MFFQTDKEAREYCKKYENAERLADAFFYRDNKGKGWICKCGSGTGKNGTGISLKKETGLFHCFSCNSSWDIFGLYMHEKDCDFPTAKRDIFKEMNITTEQTQARNHNQNQRQRDKEDEDAIKAERNARYLKELESSDYDLENNADVIAYLSKRNISIETAKRFNLRQHFRSFRYMEQAEDLIIIPTSDASFLYRSVSSAIKRKSAGKSYIFNPAACTNKGVFVCEGAFDALSLEECDFNAIAMNGVGKADFIRLAKLNKDTTFFICTDKDAAGKKACKELIEELRELDIKAFSALDIIADNCKDVNETLCEVGRDAFIQRVNEYLQDPALSEREEYERNFSAAKAVDEFESEETDKEQAIPTSFSDLDRRLDGGLHCGFYVFGAGTAMGKTAFVLQLADNIAKAGTDVLYFSLEMSQRELIARSLSRESYFVDSQNALSTRQVLKKRTQNEEEKTALKEAFARYKQYAKHLYFFESIADTKAEDIRKTIANHIAITNRKCIVVVDYVQILASADNRLTDKQAIDKNVVELKRISRDFNICVFALSSFNRESYNAVVSLSSLKESGSLEFTSDCVLAMQLAGFDYEDKESDNNRLKRIRELKERNTRKKERGDAIEMQLKILKNRNGVTCDDIRLMFKSRYNYFYEKLF